MDYLQSIVRDSQICGSDPGRNALLNRIQTIFRIEEIERWQGCFVVVTDHKIRVRYPKKRASWKRTQWLHKKLKESLQPSSVQM